MTTAQLGALIDRDMTMVAMFLFIITGQLATLIILRMRRR